MKGELQLFILWEKARKGEARILDDLRKRFEVLCVRELRFEGDPLTFWRRFYGPALVNAQRKAKSCGTGPFLLVVVRDPAPAYEEMILLGRRHLWNAGMVKLKDQYRNWVGRKHRVHGTCAPEEFARDILALTGHPASEWESGPPPEPWRFQLPEYWRMDTGDGYDADLLPEPSWDAADPTLLRGEVFLEGKYINDTFRNCTANGRSCVEKISSKAAWSVRNEFDIGRKIHAAAPAVTPEFHAYRYFPVPQPRASVAAEKIAGPALTELLRRGLSPAQADSFAADLLTLADALRTTGIVHRDLFTDNLLLGADGHLKAIDWQLAIERDRYQEDDWVRRHWKFRYVVFGVNRDLPLGHWNDFRALAAVLAQFPQTKAVAAARERLLAEADGMTFAAPPNTAERIKLFGYAISLRLQMLLRGKRHRKYAQLERRYRTIVKRPAGGNR